MIAKNNPLNVRFSSSNNWLGQEGNQRGFVKFTNVNYCLRAVFKILMSYRKRGIRDLQSIIFAYAPPFENNSMSYLRFVASRLGVEITWCPQTLFAYSRLIRVMAVFEGNPLDMSSLDVLHVLEGFSLKVPPD